MSDTENVNEKFYGALSVLPYPATQEPTAGGAPLYLSWFEVLLTPTLYASNEAQRFDHMVQVDIFSQRPIGGELAEVMLALRRAGIRVTSCGPCDYEADTKYHHLPITCRWVEGGSEYAEQ